VILLSNLLLVELDYGVNWRLKFRLASKRGDLGDKEILQQFTALFLDEFTCSCSRSTCKKRGKFARARRGKSQVKKSQVVLQIK